MHRSLVRNKSRLVTWLVGGMSVLLVGSVIRYPAQSFAASLGGLGVWWNMVFPALLPYLILCELMPRISPSSRHAWLAGMMYGYPVGAETAVELYRQGRINSYRARHLLLYAHAASPILLLTIVSVVYLQKPAIGPFIALVHYGSLALVLMLLGPWLRRSKAQSLQLGASESPSTTQPGFGQLLGNAVGNALQRLMQLGGTMMVFAVLAQLLAESGVVSTAYVPYLLGAFEPHLGAYALARTSGLPPLWTIALISATLAWSGIAVHLSVRSALTGTPLRYAPFLIGRLLQAALAFGLTVKLWPVLVSRYPNAIPTTAVAYQDETGSITNLWPHPEAHIGMAVLCLALVGMALFVRRKPKRETGL